MGSVYRARDLHFPNVVKLVAVKEMVNLAPDPQLRKTVVENFEREANILATLTHPSIPSIFDYFSGEDRSYLVLEYINGKDLEAVIRDTEGFLSPAQVIAWGIELCDVVSFLHNHKPDKIIFRDMKPSNVMIDNRGHVMLVDFGIAKQFQTGQKGTMIGTEGYSPPEQYRGEATHLADIYALGATLHHLLTKRDPRLEPPFSFDERPITGINQDISSEVEAVVSRALEYEPKDRFPTIDDMKEALMAAARQTGLLSRMPSSAAPTIQTDGIKPLWKFKCEDEIRGTPALFDNTVFIGCYDNNLYAINAADGESKWKYPTDGGVVSRPAIADGNVFFGSEDQRLHVISARAGTIAWSHYAEGPVRSSPRIAEGHVFIGSDDGCLHAVNSTTGRSVWTFSAAAPIRSTPFVAHDFIYVGSENGEFYCVDFKGSVKWQFRAKRGITSSPLVTEHAVYFSSLDGHLYSLDPKSGWVLWKFRLGKGSISSPVILDDLIFTGAADGYIYAIDLKTSKEAWRFRTEHQVTGSPIIYRDALYCASFDSHLYCLDAKTGQLRWKFATEGPITGSPLVYDDIVYIGSTDHQIYALLA
ncbi:MAG: serine/threonine-protein kinase [Anaerolineae bacterium]|nr:serine/threonine-protein kinase [Anaerolineae bacterium]MBT4312335.1 serine/threonine-protein kinase [Anaerolineae bacterium]